jgi:hypothetical protein
VYQLVGVSTDAQDKVKGTDFRGPSWSTRNINIWAIIGHQEALHFVQKKYLFFKNVTAIIT